MPPHHRTSRAALAAVLLSAVLASGCVDDTVSVAFRPPPGAAYTYEVRVESESSSDVEGVTLDGTGGDDVVLRADHTVVSADDGASRVQVQLRLPGQDGAEPPTFVVVLDRLAQQARVEGLEGRATGVLGVFGLAEIFPAATAGSAGTGRHSPGDRWDIDQPVELPGLAPTRVRGHGRLAELGVVGGRPVAVVETVTDLAVDRARTTAAGTLRLRGVQTTTARTSHSVDDGSVEEGASVTTGRFGVELLPPSGDRSLAVRGTVTVKVSSTTRRLA